MTASAQWSSRRRVLPAGHPDARDEPSQVPLPRARMGLVEVVEVEHELALRGGVEPEVAEVRVAADHRGDPGGRQSRDVFGHHDRRSPQEAVRRRDHAGDPDGDQLLEPTLVRLPDQLDGVRPVGGRLPVPQGPPGHLLAQRPPDREALAPRRRLLAQRAERLALRRGQHGVPSCTGRHAASSARSRSAAPAQLEHQVSMRRGSRTCFGCRRTPGRRRTSAGPSRPGAQTSTGGELARPLASGCGQRSGCAPMTESSCSFS